VLPIKLLFLLFTLLLINIVFIGGFICEDIYEEAEELFCIVIDRFVYSRKTTEASYFAIYYGDPNAIVT